MADELKRATGPMSKDEFMARFRSGERTFKGMDLSGISLAGQSLKGIDFSDSVLHDADFTGATLSFSQFQRSDLSSAKLHLANLLDAVLSEASLVDASAEGALMLSCNFERADLRRANLNYCMMAGARLAQARLSEAELLCTNLSEADLTDAAVDRASFGGTVLCDVDLAGIQGLAYGEHTGSSYVDINTLRRTAESANYQKHRCDGIRIFLRHCGIDKERTCSPKTGPREMSDVDCKEASTWDARANLRMSRSCAWFARSKPARIRPTLLASWA